MAFPLVPILMGAGLLAALAFGGGDEAAEEAAPTKKRRRRRRRRTSTPITEPEEDLEPTETIPITITGPEPDTDPEESKAADIAAEIAAVLRENSPAALRALAHKLEAEGGNAKAVESLRAAAIAIEDALVEERIRQSVAEAEDLAQQALEAKTADEKAAAMRAAQEAAARAQREADAERERQRLEAEAAIAAGDLEAAEVARLKAEAAGIASAAAAAAEEAARLAQSLMLPEPEPEPEPEPVPENPKRVLALKVSLHLFPGPYSGPVRKWNEDRELVEDYQEVMGLVEDGLYGPNTGLTIAQFGIIPARPFYFSSNATKARADKERWTKIMLNKAELDPARAAAWTAASEVGSL